MHAYLVCPRVRESWTVLFIIKMYAAGQFILKLQQKDTVCRGSEVNQSHIYRNESKSFYKIINPLSAFSDAYWNKQIQSKSINIERKHFNRIQYDSNINVVLFQGSASINTNNIYWAINLVRSFHNHWIVSAVKLQTRSLSMNKSKYLLT